MRLAAKTNRPPVLGAIDERQLAAFGPGLRRPPSQKELANVLGVTTRHLRRWEAAEGVAGQPCSRPYSLADLWRLYQRRERKGWDRDVAARIGLSDVFERFDLVQFGHTDQAAKDPRATTAAMMLRSVATETREVFSDADGLPHLVVAGLAAAARAQLRLIVDCPPARDVLVRAFFEAALIAEGRGGDMAVASDPSSALSA